MGKEVPASPESVRPPETPDDTGPEPEGAAGERGVDTPQAFVRHSAVMSVGTGLSRLTGFLRVAAMAYALGVAESRLADAYNVANTTPNIIYELAAGGIIASVFVPVFVERLQTEGRERAWHTARTVLTFAFLVLTAVMVVAIAGSGWIIRAYTIRVPAGPARDAERALATFLLRWFMPQIVFYGLGAGVATGLLNAHRRFAWPMFAPILNNLFAILTFFVFVLLPGPAVPTPDGITTAQRTVLAVGTTLGVVVMSLALWPSLRRLGFRWRWTLDWKDRGFRRIGRLAGWAFVYVIVNQIGYVVVIILAGQRQGGYTAYSSAFIFFQLPYAIFAVSIMTAMLPSLSSRWADGDVDTFRQQLTQGIRGTAFVMVPAAFGYLALGKPIIRLLLQHGVTQAQSTELLASVLSLFSVGLFSFASFQLLLRAFYAMQDTRTPALINVGAVALNTGVNLIYYRYFGVRGLALGHATAYTGAAVAAVLILRRRTGGLDGRRLAGVLGQILLAGMATGAAAFLVSRWVGHWLGTASLLGQLVQVGGGMAVGVATFLGVAVAFRLPELALLRTVLVARLRR